MSENVEKTAAALERQGRPEESARLLRAGLKKAPGSTRLLLRLSRALALSGDYLGARAACLRAVRREPGSLEARLRLLSVEELLDFEAEAAATLRAVSRLAEEALRRGPDSANARLQAASFAEDLGELEVCVRHLSAALKLDPACLPALLKAGTFELWSRRWSSALGLARRALSLQPDNCEALTLAGASLAGLGRGAQARRSLDAALKREPFDPVARTWRAELSLRAGRPRAALADLAEVVGRSDNPLGSNALHALASLRAGSRPEGWSLVCVERRLPKRFAALAAELRSGDPRRMDRALTAVLARLGGNRTARSVFLSPSGKLALYGVPDPADRLEQLQRRLLTQTPARVLARLRAGIPEDPAWAHSFIGETFLWLGDNAGAEREFRAALAAEPEMRWPHIGLGAAALMSGRPERALAHLARAKAAGAPRRNWLAFRGEALRRQGRHRAAARDLEAALALMPRRLSARFNLALARLGMRRAKAAAEIFKRLNAAAPHFMRRAALRAGVSAERLFDAPTAGVMRRVLEAGLALMRGNRSSWLPLFFDEKGRPRAISI